ncbi:glycosyltransferase family 2 protein [Lacticaseibacillus paracasei]|uniref:glycosyltransferase family 2 protein n=1 Tax=Lacticaseibacillus paracasei TaxID=1597 RepID=UPI00404671BB
MSIIVPMYNVETEILPLMKVLSLLDYEGRSVEFIFIDDGCTDGTLSVVQDFLQTHLNFRANCKVFQQLNEGLSAARNRGLSESEGQYVWFIDSDDLVNFEYINSVLLPVLARHQFDFLQVGYQYFSHDIPTLGLQDSRVYTIDSEHMFKKLAIGEIESFAWAHIFARELIENNDFFPVGMAYEDVATTYKLIGRAGKMGELHGVVYYYRNQEGSITHSGNPQYVLDLCQTIKKLQSDAQSIQKQFNKEDWNLFLSRMLMVAYVESLRADCNTEIRVLRRVLKQQILSMHPNNPPFEYKAKVLLLRLRMLGIYFSMKDSIRK